MWRGRRQAMKLIVWLVHKIRVPWWRCSISVTKMTLVLLLTFAIGLAATAHAIIVERNYHLYFRVPIANGGAIASTTGDTKYHIMQCPLVSGGAVIMPKPQDMTICVVVGIYTHRAGGKQQQQPHSTPVKARPRSKLRTKVDYTRRKEVHRASVRKPQAPPQPIFHSYDRRRHTKPVEANKPASNPVALALQQQRGQQEQQEEDQQYVAANNNFEQITNPQSVEEGVRENEEEELAEAEEVEEEEGNVEAEDADEHNGEYDDDDDDDDNDYAYDYDVMDETVAKANDDTAIDETPLKYIGVRDLIKKFAKNSAKHFLNPELKDNKSNKSESNNDADKFDDDDDDDFSLESERFFANHETFANGDKWRSYQNSYHRDEFYNDHIFYDDGEDTGGYHTHSKVHETI